MVVYLYITKTSRSRAKRITHSLQNAQIPLQFRRAQWGEWRPVWCFAAGSPTANPCWARGEVLTAGYGWFPGLRQTSTLRVSWERSGVATRKPRRGSVKRVGDALLFLDKWTREETLPHGSE